MSRNVAAVPARFEKSWMKRHQPAATGTETSGREQPFGCRIRRRTGTDAYMSPTTTAAKHDAASFRRLHDANRQRVWRLLARMVGPQEADDLTQIVFARAAKALPRFRGDAQTSTWLYRIATNVAVDWLRGRPAHEAKITVALPEGLDDEVRESDASSAALESPSSPEQELIRKEMRACIRGVIARLPDSDRTVLMLGELAGFSDDETARTLGISRSSAKVRLHRARGRLKAALETRCDFYRNENNELACEPKPAACCAPPLRPGCSGAAGPDYSSGQ
jgi:RNA polymerase sigma-70 factor (ECF subfamily)